jgi:hypothetical protein
MGTAEQAGLGAVTKSTAQLSTDRLLNIRQATPRARIIEDRLRGCNVGCSDVAGLSVPNSAPIPQRRSRHFARPSLEEPRTQ